MRKGQAVVIVLLMIGVALTVGLSIVSRSITELSVTTTQEEASRALEAAEAGIERAIGGAVVGTSQGTIPSTNATFDVINSLIGSGSVYQVPIGLVEGDVASIDMTGFVSNDQVRVCWGQSPAQPSVEVVAYYTSGGVAGAARKGYTSTSISGFSGAASGCVHAAGFSYSRSFTFTTLGVPAGATISMMRIKILNATNPQRVLVAGLSRNITSQGNEVISTGQSGLAAQKVKATVVNSDLPPMFDNALFSGTTLVQ